MVKLSNLGCFIDQSNRTVQGNSYSPLPNSNDICVQLCDGYGNSIAGTQYG